MSNLVVIRLFGCIGVLFGLIATICGNCDIKFSADPLVRPKVFQIIGKRKIDLSISENTDYLELFEKQKIELVCDTKFESPQFRQEGNSVRVECNGNQLKFSSGYGYYEGYVMCSPLKWKLYESSGNIAWCPNNVTSYILARPMTSPSTDYEYLAGVCYDTYNNSLKSLNYKIAPKYDDNFHPSVLEKLYKPVNEIKHYRDIFRKRSVNEKNYDNEAFIDWIKYSKYNLSSILQIPRIKNQFYAGSFLDIIWWPSLRMGNWKRYEKSLEQHIEYTKLSYDILAGVSDVAKVPIIENCAKNFTLKVLEGNVNHQIPFYVWNYLHATDNSSEIVIIGVNSPFYEFYAEKDVIFCNDKCQKIPWLKSKSSTFRYSALGIIFCCSVDDVISSKRLDGFPTVNMNLLPQQQKYTPAIISTLNEYEFDDNDDWKIFGKR